MENSVRKTDHERFHYKSTEDIRKRAEELGVSIPFANDCAILRTSTGTDPCRFANRLGTAPMEGADSLPDGSPSELTERRYLREARGGSAILWFEAVSIVKEARSSATQLYIDEFNLDSYKRLTEKIRTEAVKANGREPYLVMQANHSGRYSNPDGRPAPLIAYRHPELEKYRAADDGCIVSDDYLMRLEEKFGEAAKIAREAGFDAVDVKCCHGYLPAELTSAYTRPGLYGGCYENRTRFLKNAVAAAKVFETGDFSVTCRLGIYDGYAWPYGFGVNAESGIRPDPAEPVRLVRELRETYGMKFICLTMGNPYATTHITRPFDVGKYIPEEHPLVGIARMIHGIGEVKKSVPDMTVWASAPSYLRQFSDLYTAGAVEEGLCDGMLFGRMAFADPDFANEILKDGRIDPVRVCVTCGKCGDLIRAHKPAGCAVRDTEVYLPLWKEYREKTSEPAGFRG